MIGGGEDDDDDNNDDGDNDNGDVHAVWSWVHSPVRAAWSSHTQESSIGLRLCGRCILVLTNSSVACDYMEARTEQNIEESINMASTSMYVWFILQTNTI